MNSEERDEYQFQKEIDKVITKVIKLDLGDATSNHDLKQ